jgi:hypothetical protein
VIFVTGYEDMLIEVSEFLCDHFSDPRIVNAGSKETLILALAGFTCSPNTLSALERVPYTRYAANIWLRTILI